MGDENGKFDYEKRIADYRASTDQKALEWRAAVYRRDVRHFRGGSRYEPQRKWMLITSARIEKRKACEHL